MPSMVLACAPLLRYDLAAKDGLVALEDSKTARNQTPFAKCDIRWQAAVVVSLASPPPVGSWTNMKDVAACL